MITSRVPPVEFIQRRFPSKHVAIPERFVIVVTGRNPIINTVGRVSRAYANQNTRCPCEGTSRSWRPGESDENYGPGYVRIMVARECTATNSAETVRGVD